MIGEKQTQGQLETILRPGQIVGGKYCVERLIGKGGMAAVWAGVNQRTGKRVALKVILRSFASSEDASELFRREALAASRVNHPNVVNVFDVIDHEGMTCIVMEMLDGEPFGTYLARKGFLGVDEAVALLLPAMRGVAAANAQGVVHRDLKPQNVFICIGPDGRLITTKVLDFGISMVMEKTIDAPLATQLLTTHGTPAYMSPEHISGSSDIDERADVYGFGVLFFEALTGQLPFLGEPGPALLVRILNEPAPRVTLFKPDLPPEMVAIIERAMAKDPKERFPTLDLFIRAIEDHLLPPSPLPRALTPMVGVPMYALGEQKSGVADPVVQVFYRTEPSGLHEIAETKALYTLPRETVPREIVPLEAEGGEGEPSRRVVAPGRTGEVPPAASTTLVNLRPSLGRDIRRLFAKRALPAAMFVSVLGFVGWLAFPLPLHVGARDEAPPAARTVRSAPAVPPPVAEPVKVVEPPLIPQPAVADEAANDATAAEVAPAPEPVRMARIVAKSTPKQKPLRPGPPAKAVSPRGPALQPEERRLPKSAASAAYTGTRTQPSAPRAGVLSPDDF